MTEMLQTSMKRATKRGLRLAPFIGIGCPGMIPTLDGHEVTVLMHNDAVVQGLSEVPFMHDIEHRGVMTIGTGLGNARFTNRTVGKE